MVDSVPVSIHSCAHAAVFSAPAILPFGGKRRGLSKRPAESSGPEEVTCC